MRNKSVRTVSAEYAGEFGVGPAGELLLAESVPDELVVAQDDDELRAEPGREEGAVLLREVAKVQMEVALDVGQRAEDGQTPGARW